MELNQDWASPVEKLTKILAVLTAYFNFLLIFFSTLRFNRQVLGGCLFHQPAGQLGINSISKNVVYGWYGQSHSFMDRRLLSFHLTIGKLMPREAKGLVQGTQML